MADSSDDGGAADAALNLDQPSAPMLQSESLLESEIPKAMDEVVPESSTTMESGAETQVVIPVLSPPSATSDTEALLEATPTTTAPGESEVMPETSTTIEVGSENPVVIPELSPHSTTSEAPVATTTASVASTTFNVMKAMLGSGVLALSSGLAAVSDYKSMVLPANLLFAVLGIMSAYTFALYGRLCHATNAKSLGDIWKTVFKSEKSIPISLANFSFCYGGCLIFLLIIGDTMSSLARAIMSSNASLSTLVSTAGWLVSRQTAILSVMATLLIPLCNLKSMAALAPVSLVGVLASIVSSAFVVWRCPALFTNSPYAMPGGSALGSLPEKFLPSFGSYRDIMGPAPLVLLGMGGMALMAHFSAPDFYQSFVGATTATSSESTKQQLTAEDKKSANLPLKKYMKATWLSYLAVGIVNALTMSCGFLTFGGNSAGMILNNYATKDFGAALSRMLVAVSMIGGFPMIFMALRAAADDLFPSKNDVVVTTTETYSESAPAKTGWMLKAALLSSLTAISLVVKDAGFVVGFTGAVMGTAIIYTFPALMFLRLAKESQTSDGGEELSEFPVYRGERMVCRALLAFGLVASVAAGATTVLNSYFPHLL